MNKSVKTTLAATAALFLLSCASASFAQYGACEPACDVPAVEACAPTCEAPTCDVPSCAPSCLPNDGYCPQYANSYGGVCNLVDDVARVAVSPFRWIAGAFTEGIYPDCGCAPRPPKTNCNPCNICGDYVGGCNDGSCGANYCNPCAGNYGAGQLTYAETQGGYPAQSYNSPSVYDVESYDSSPTRGNYSSANPFSMDASFTQTLRNVFGTQRPANASFANARTNQIMNVQPNVFANAQPNQIVSVQPNSVRPVNYEQRPVQMQDIRQAQNDRAMPQPNARQLRELQNKQNVRIVAATPETNAAPTAKTFGKTRAIK